MKIELPLKKDVNATKKGVGMRIYVSGPIVAETHEDIVINCNIAMSVGMQIMEKGHIPFVPHLSYWMDLFAKSQGVLVPYDRWIDEDLRWVSLCDGFFYIKESPGALIELKHALSMDKRIFTNINQIGPIAVEHTMPLINPESQPNIELPLKKDVNA